MCIKCVRYGGTNVACEAVINPNGYVFKNYTDESFEYAWCEDCDDWTTLINPKESRDNILKEYREYINKYIFKPQYVDCIIVWKDSAKSEAVRISLIASNQCNKDEEVFFYCKNIYELLSLTEYGKEDFVVSFCEGYGIWDEFSNVERDIQTILEKCAKYISTHSDGRISEELLNAINFKLKENEDFRVVSTISREDLISQGYDGDSVDDRVMKTIALIMNESYIDSGNYWRELNAICMRLNIKSLNK